MNFRKFVILSNPRTGSEYLARLLNEHPDIRCLGEVFAIPPGDGVWNRSGYKLQNKPFAYLQALDEQSGKLLFGFKQISNWLPNAGFADVCSFIQQSALHGYCFILIQRMDLIKEYVSFMLMMEQNYGHINKEACEARSITLNVIHAYAQMRKWDAFNKSCEAALSSLDFPYLSLLYEEDFAEDKKVKRKAFDFLEVEPIELNDPLQRTNPYRLEELVANYDEMIDFLSKKRRFIRMG